MYMQVHLLCIISNFLFTSPSTKSSAEKENVIKAEVVDESEPSVKNEAKVKSEPGVKSEPSVKSEPGVKSEPRVKREDTGLGINDFESEQEPMDTSGAGANVDNEDDDEESDPVNDFLEYCVLSSNQKEIDEAANEGGVSKLLILRKRRDIHQTTSFIESHYRNNARIQGYETEKASPFFQG